MDSIFSAVVIYPCPNPNPPHPVPHRDETIRRQYIAVVVYVYLHIKSQLKCFALRNNSTWVECFEHQVPSKENNSRSGPPLRTSSWALSKGKWRRWRMESRSVGYNKICYFPNIESNYPCMSNSSCSNFVISFIISVSGMFKKPSNHFFKDASSDL